MITKDDLLQMSGKELQKLRNDIDSVMSEVEKKERELAREAAQRAAAEYGYPLSELFPQAGKAAAKTGRAKLPAKYRNPEDPTQTWSGRGRKPRWIHAAEEAGKEIEEFAI